jgi:hypothetical protein
METGYAGIVIVEPTDMERAGMAGTHFPALPVGGSGRCAAIRWNFADRQRLAAVLDGGGGLEDGHGAGLLACRPGIKSEGREEGDRGCE